MDQFDPNSIQPRTSALIGAWLMASCALCSVLTLTLTRIARATYQRGPETPTPTATVVGQQWVTIWSQSGQGDANSAAFSVPSHWRLVWTCDPASFQGQPYYVQVDLEWQHDGTPYRISAVNTTCQAGATSGYTDFGAGASATISARIWLLNATAGRRDASTATWTLQAQVLKP
jgi:hypothetical protein